MIGFTEEDIRAAAHESAHAAAAILQGLQVDFVSIDKGLVDKLGECQTSFRADDPRSVPEKCHARAVVALAAVLWEPGIDLRSSDGDVRSAYEVAAMVQAEDPAAWVAAKSAYASRMLQDPRFGAVADAITIALLESPELGSESVLRIGVEAQLP